MAKHETKHNKYAKSILANVITVLIFNAVIIYFYVRYCKSLNTLEDYDLQMFYMLLWGTVVVVVVLTSVS